MGGGEKLSDMVAGLGVGVGKTLHPYADVMSGVQGKKGMQDTARFLPWPCGPAHTDID